MVKVMQALAVQTSAIYSLQDQLSRCRLQQYSLVSLLGKYYFASQGWKRMFQYSGNRSKTLTKFS